MVVGGLVVVVVVDVGDVVGGFVGLPVGEAVGEAVGEVVTLGVGELVGAEPPHVTVTTVALVVARSRDVPSHVAVVVRPTGTAVAPAGTAAGGRGRTVRPPATATRPRRWAAAAFRVLDPGRVARTSCTSRVGPLRTTVVRAVPRGCGRWAARTATAERRRAPGTALVSTGGTNPLTAEAAVTGVPARVPEKAVVIIDIRPAGCTVAVGAPSPAPAVRYQAESRRPSGPLTPS